MRQADFLTQLYALLDATVSSLDVEQRLRLVEDVVGERRRALRQGETLSCRFIPFTPGHRPTDEARHAGLGSSDNSGLLLPQGQGDQNWIYLLFRVDGLNTCTPDVLEDLRLDFTLSLAGTDGRLTTLPLPGWDRRPLEPAVLDRDDQGDYFPRPVSLGAAGERRLVLRLAPAEAFLPGATWQWSELDEQIRSLATDADDPFTFGHLFTQLVHVHLRVTRHGVPLASATTWVDICDARRFGSLYQRIVDRLVKPDTARQARAQGLPELDYVYHPWFPVLHIGSDKAALYTRALVEDIVEKKRHLADPHWLMRVGLYLEFLTCLGVIEAVKAEVGDLLSPAERKAFDNHPAFAPIRERVNPRAWRKVWQLRDIAFAQVGVPATGPVSAANLLQKRKATLAFLETHHDDLKHAIDLAGPNAVSAQETWHRVFRDAERAVMRQTSLAFPELAHLSPQLREFVLWHQQGKLGSGLRWLPKQFTALFGDQDGLFASAGSQYRASMNEVAEWAKHKGLMDYTGYECVPTDVSLLNATMGKLDEALRKLQHRDGYSADLSPMAEGSTMREVPQEEVFGLMSDAPFFQILADQDRRQLAESVRAIHLGPMERIVIQGDAGSSLFVVGEGSVEALVRQKDGTDQIVDVKRRGEVFGEISLLTGDPRSATVRARDGATIYEIGKRQYEPIIHANPGLVDDLSALMERHMANMRSFSDHYEAEQERQGLNLRIRRFFFGGGEPGNGPAV